MKISSIYSHPFKIFERVNPCKDKQILFQLRNKKWKQWGRKILTVYSYQKQRDTEPSLHAWYVGASDHAVNSHDIPARVFNSLQFEWYLENLKAESGDVVYTARRLSYWLSEIIHTRNPTSWIPNDNRGLNYFTKATNNLNTVKSKLQQRKHEHSFSKWGIKKKKSQGALGWQCMETFSGNHGLALTQ